MTPPEDLKACFQGAGGGYIRPWRKSRHKEKQRVLRRLENIAVCHRLRKSATQILRADDWFSSALSLYHHLDKLEFVLLSNQFEFKGLCT